MINAPANRACTVTILGAPVSANRLYRVGRDGRVYKSAVARAWQATVGWEAKAAGVLMVESGPVSVTIRYYHQYDRHADSDNICKCLLDALRGIAYIDDAQVSGVVVTTKRDRENPRIEITIEEAA